MMNRRQLLGAGAAGATLVSSQAWGKTLNMGLSVMTTNCWAYEFCLIIYFIRK